MYARRARGGALCRAFRIFIIISVLIGVVLITPAPANPPDVISIVDRMKVAFEPARPSVRKMVITVSSDDGHEHATWIAGVARKQLPDGKRNLIVLLEPESERGNALLLGERGDQQDTMWRTSATVKERGSPERRTVKQW